jgi:hypothetical protein
MCFSKIGYFTFDLKFLYFRIYPVLIYTYIHIITYLTIQILMIIYIYIHVQIFLYKDNYDINIGCFKFGLRILCCKIYPVKVGATYMDSFLFNIGKYMYI